MAIDKLKKPGLEVCKYAIANQTISSGGSLTVDVSSAVPDGKSIVGYCSVQIGNYMLPYLAQLGNSKATYIETANTGSGQVVIRNTASVWSNYTVTVTFVVE